MPPNIGKPQDTSQSFLGGRSHEALLGMHFYVPMEKSWIALSGTYAFKDNSWQNMIYIHGETGFSSVENTALTFFVDVLQPMGAARDIPPFDIRRFQTAEYAIIPGASFKVTLESGLMFNALYSLRVIGATSWATGTVMLSAGYAF